MLMNYLQNILISNQGFLEIPEQKESFCRFIENITKFMLDTRDQGMKLQLHEFLKTLLENEFNDVFYQNGFSAISEFLKPEEKKEGESTLVESVSTEDAKHVNFSQNLAIDLINKCVSEDNFRAKTHLQSHALMEKIAGLASQKSKYLNVGVVKFFKAMLSTGFIPYANHFIKTNLLDCIFDVIEQNGGK
jgi:hypothetical protein